MDLKYSHKYVMKNSSLVAIRCQYSQCLIKKKKITLAAVLKSYFISNEKEGTEELLERRFQDLY